MGDEEHRKSNRWRRKRRKDFWRAWRDEWHGPWDDEDPASGAAHRAGHRGRGFGPRPPFPPRKKAHVWREFFHDFMGAWPEDHWAFGGRRFNPWRQGMDGFNPLVASLMSKGGGLLPLYVLQLLSERPLYGNEIMDFISERTGGQWLANPGAIYPLMTMLEEQDLVEGEWLDPHKRTVRIYELTETGEQELVRLKAVMRPKLDEAIEVLQDLARDLNGADNDSEDDEQSNWKYV